MKKQDPMLQTEPVSRRTLLLAAVASFVPWTQSGCTRDLLKTSREQDWWQVPGNAAERYQRYLVPAVFTPWATDLVERAGLHPNDRVLDVACGTGVVARLAAQRVARGGTVVGLDFSGEMLAVARRLSPAPGPVIDWQEGDAMSIPFEKGTFHKVFCQQGLQFFSDPAKALREMHRVLTPGGRVAVSVWRDVSQNPYPAALVSTIARHLNVESAVEMREPFAFGDPDRLRLLIGNAGFREVTIDDVALEMHVQSLPEFVRGHLSCFTFYAALAAKSVDGRQLLIAELYRALKPYTNGAELRVPWRAMVGIALK